MKCRSPSRAPVIGRPWGVRWCTLQERAVTLMMILFHHPSDTVYSQGETVEHVEREHQESETNGATISLSRRIKESNLLIIFCYLWPAVCVSLCVSLSLAFK